MRLQNKASKDQLAPTTKRQTPDNREQSERFLGAAKDGADEADKGAQKALKAVVKPR